MFGLNYTEAEPTLEEVVMLNKAATKKLVDVERKLLSAESKRLATDAFRKQVSLNTIFTKIEELEREIQEVLKIFYLPELLKS